MRWMQFTAMILLLPAGSCLNGASAPAICDGTQAARTAHAAALATDGGDESVVTGARLIRLIDAGCN
jgi:hypothetical protein